MKRILFLLLILVASACKPQQYIPTVKEETVITYKDSTIYHNDTVHVELVKEAYNYYSTLLDTITMETEYARAGAYIDTSINMLHGYITNKHVKIPVAIEYKDRVITKDTTIFKEKPVYVEVTNKKAEREAAAWKFFFILAAAMALVFGITIIIKNTIKI